jgi:hypothetical protein
MANNSFQSLQNSLTSNLQQLTESTVVNMKPILDNLVNSYSTLNNVLNTSTLSNYKIPNMNYGDSCDCCPPTDCCPPHCLAKINRTAMSGERILVPITIKNDCSTAKTYRIGVRELIDENGNNAPNQPQLNKTSVTLQPNQSEVILMKIDLDKFNNGSTYNAEIVLREKEINQNICFTLNVNNASGNLVSPKSEKSYHQKWQSWKSHFYCEPKKLRTNNG